MGSFKGCEKMERIKKGDLEYLTFPSLDGTGLVKCAFSTRHGGVSTGFYSSMNLTLRTGDDPKMVFENFRIITEALGTNTENLVPARANHGTTVVRASRKPNGSWEISPNAEKYDAVVTNEKNLCIGAFGSDCVIIFYLDTKKKAIGISHGGWRGTVDAMPKQVIGKMKTEFGSEPQDILIGISPSIGKCCFEVDPPVADEFKSKLPYSEKYIFPHESTPGKLKIDLWGINSETLMLCGIPRKNIEIAEICTMCHTEDFFSHRKMGMNRGGNGGFIYLQNV